jgi:GSCFA family protein
MKSLKRSNYYFVFLRKLKSEMQFRTVISIKKSAFPIDYDSKILSLGSCFAENMGEKFDYFKFQNTVNPFGIIFNPVSIAKIIRKAITGERFTENDIFFHNDLWHCFDVHSELSTADKDIFLHELNQILEATTRRISESTHVIITLGTAWVYRNLSGNEIVANCHKVPQKEFAKELLAVDVIEQSLKNIADLISSVNKEAKLIFTVSPVRHSKDGFVENQQSKSHLITALHQALHSAISNQQSAYFPSYEIMMDELRDYRFYAEDMLHPNQVAIDYIWNRFSEAYCAEPTFAIMEEVGAIQKALQHRPFNPDSASHQKFLSNLAQKISILQNQFSHISFEK